LRYDAVISFLSRIFLKPLYSSIIYTTKEYRSCNCVNYCGHYW